MKKILLTGVSGEIGSATAKVLTKEGYFVYGVYNSNEYGAKKLKEELINIEILQCDFSNRTNVIKLILKLKDEKFYGIVNCAGVFIDMDFDNFDIAVWDEVFDVNVHAPLLLVQGLRNNLEKGGSIVNIASTDGMTGANAGIAYSSSKASLINLTQSLSNILATQKIRVNNIAPGWINSGMKAPKKIIEQARELNLLERVGACEEVADVISFLLSQKAGYINGTTIVVDGGDSATDYILQKESEILRK